MTITLTICFYRKDWFAEKHLRPGTDWKSFIRCWKYSNDPAKKRYAITMPISSGGTHRLG